MNDCYEAVKKLNFSKLNISAIRNMDFSLCLETERKKIMDYAECMKTKSDQLVLEDEIVGYVYNNLDELNLKLNNKILIKRN